MNVSAWRSRTSELAWSARARSRRGAPSSLDRLDHQPLGTRRPDRGDLAGNADRLPLEPDRELIARVRVPRPALLPGGDDRVDRARVAEVHEHADERDRLGLERLVERLVAEAVGRVVVARHAERARVEERRRVMEVALELDRVESVPAPPGAILAQLRLDETERREGRLLDESRATLGEEGALRIGEDRREPLLGELGARGVVAREVGPERGEDEARELPREGVVEERLEGLALHARVPGRELLSEPARVGRLRLVEDRGEHGRDATRVRRDEVEALLLERGEVVVLRVAELDEPVVTRV